MEWEFAQFEFVDPGPLVDDDLELVLAGKYPGDPQRQHVPAYEFNLIRRDTTDPMGFIELRVALSEALAQYGGHIGYTVHPPYRGHRYAARACRLLFPLARAHHIDALLITCATDNTPSRRTCQRIGGRLLRTATIEIEPGVWRPTCYYQVDLGNGDIQSD